MYDVESDLVPISGTPVSGWASCVCIHGVCVCVCVCTKPLCAEASMRQKRLVHHHVVMQALFSVFFVFR
jgi:hypothetical protein